MRIHGHLSRWIAGAAVIAFSLCVAADDDDDHDHDKVAPADQQAASPTLNREQQRAVGIVVAHPLAAKAPARTAAFGLVLDATLLIADLGEKDAADAALLASSAELARLRGLFAGGAGASMRALEAAQADQAKTRAEAQAAAARFDLHWSPVAALSAPAREKLLDAASSGHSLLVRADLPGRHSLGLLPTRALLDVDGIQVPGHVLGALRQDTETQSVGLLVEVQNAPLGLGPGARVPLALLAEERAGLVLPRDAVFYDDNGAYVYKRLGNQAGDETGKKAGDQGGEAAGEGAGDETGATAVEKAVDGVGQKVGDRADAKAGEKAVDGVGEKIGDGADAKAGVRAGEKAGVRAGDDQTRYAPVKVTLLLPYGDGWLAEGVDDDDDIVVRGAGVLWSLQGVGAHAVDDDDD